MPASYNITVRDVFDTPVELLSVWPEMAEDGAWHFSYLAPGECLKIALKVRVPRIDVEYHSSQTVSGHGFMRSFRDYSTSLLASPLSIVFDRQVSDTGLKSDSQSRGRPGEEGRANMLDRGWIFYIGMHPLCPGVCFDMPAMSSHSNLYKI